MDVGILKMRKEGAFWNAYFGPPRSFVSDDLLLGSIHIKAVSDNENRRQLFMAMMQDIVCDLIEEATGVRPQFNDPQPAPDWDRSGHA